MRTIHHSFLVVAASAAALIFLFPPAAGAALISNGIVVTIATATVGNPVNASVGVQGTTGSLVYDDGDLTGIGAESLPIHSAGESLTLPIGDESFVESDDIEFTFAPFDVPSAEFQDGLIGGFDFFVFFNFDGGGNLFTKVYDPSILVQDTSGFINDFVLSVDATGNFTIGQIMGFEVFQDQFGSSLEPTTGSPLVSGSLAFVPEPSSALLLGFGLIVTTGIRRRIAARRP